MLGSTWVHRIENAELDMLDAFAPVDFVDMRPWAGARWRPIDRRVLLLSDMVSELWAIVLEAKYAGADEPLSDDWAMPDEDLVLLQQLGFLVRDLALFVSPETTPYRLLRENTRALLWAAGYPASRRDTPAMKQAFEDANRQVAHPVPPETPDGRRRRHLYLVR